MIAIGREFIIGNWNLNGEQAESLELYTNAAQEDADEAEGSGNDWYEMVNGVPCFKVEYLLYQPLTVEEMDSGAQREYREKDGYYNVFVNVETGEIEEFEYNNGMAGLG